MPLAPPIDAIQQPAVGIYGLPVGASAGAMVLLTAAQIREHADLSGYVPYTGATGAVNLGSNGLTVGAITASGIVGINRAGVTNVPLAIQTSSTSSDGGYLYNNSGTLVSDFGVTGGGHSRWRFRDSTSAIKVTIATDGSTAFTVVGAITASGTILTRNGTSPTSIQITNTYTSSTSFGLLDIRANAAQTAYEISSFLGSAGGANLPINIGHRDSAGTFTSALSVATSGISTFGGSVYCGGHFILPNNNGMYWVNKTYIFSPTDGKLRITTLAETAGSLLDITTDGVVKLRTKADSADAALTCGAITASGVIDSPTRIRAGGDSALMEVRSGISGGGSAKSGMYNHLTLGRGVSLSSDSSLGWNGTTFTNGPNSNNLCLYSGGAGILQQRNGTSPQTFQLFNTYTSATSFGVLDIRANAAQTAYEISSFLGSAGGANLPIDIGHRDSAGTFTSALSVATSGATTLPSGGQISFGANHQIRDRGDGSAAIRAYGSDVFSWTTGLVLFDTGRIAFRSSLNSAYIGSLRGTTTAREGLGIFNAASTTVFGVLEVGAVDNPTGTLSVGNASQLVSVLGSVECGADFTFKPASSRTLSINGQFSIEMTSNTAGNLVYRGSDGTTRRAALTFV